MDMTAEDRQNFLNHWRARYDEHIRETDPDKKYTLERGPLFWLAIFSRIYELERS